MLSYPPDDTDDRVAERMRRERLAKMRQTQMKAAKRRSISIYFDEKWIVEYFIGGEHDFAQAFDFYDQAISYAKSKPCTDWLAKLTDDRVSRLIF